MLMYDGRIPESIFYGEFVANLPHLCQKERCNWRLAEDMAERYQHWSKYVKTGEICVMKSN